MNKIIAIIGMSALMFSCGNHDHSHGESKSEETTQSPEKETLHLNGSEKWPVNEATNVGMSTMRGILNSYKEVTFEGLGDSLNNQTNYIIEHCDMKGEAHDQLHLVLLPILEEIAAIKNGKKDLKSIEKQLDNYFNYFEFKN